MDIIDLFAGIGGFHQAAKELGLNCVFTSEKDRHARTTYLANHETDVMNEDITQIPPDQIPAHDILCAGFPCQPFSQAGFGKGFKDERGNLFFYIYKILQHHRPAAAFLENVRGLLKHDEGRTFKTICAALESLGYTVHSKVIFAKDFGVPQLRPRLFIIATLAKEYEWPEPIPLNQTLNEILGGQCEREIGFTLRCGGRSSGINDRHNWDGYIVDGKEIRLSPAQGAAMQGFPEGFKFPVSTAQAMKQLGNSVAVPAIKIHMKQIIEAIT